MSAGTGPNISVRAALNRLREDEMRRKVDSFAQRNQFQETVEKDLNQRRAQESAAREQQRAAQRAEQQAAAREALNVSGSNKGAIDGDPSALLSNVSGGTTANGLEKSTAGAGGVLPEQGSGSQPGQIGDTPTGARGDEGFGGVEIIQKIAQIASLVAGGVDLSQFLTSGAGAGLADAATAGAVGADAGAAAATGGAQVAAPSSLGLAAEQISGALSGVVDGVKDFGGQVGQGLGNALGETPGAVGKTVGENLATGNVEGALIKTAFPGGDVTDSNTTKDQNLLKQYVNPDGSLTRETSRTTDITTRAFTAGSFEGLLVKAALRVTGLDSGTDVSTRTTTVRIGEKELIGERRDIQKGMLDAVTDFKTRFKVRPGGKLTEDEGAQLLLDNLKAGGDFSSTASLISENFDSTEEEARDLALSLATFQEQDARREATLDALRERKLVAETNLAEFKSSEAGRNFGLRQFYGPGLFDDPKETFNAANSLNKYIQEGGDPEAARGQYYTVTASQAVHTGAFQLHLGYEPKGILQGATIGPQTAVPVNELMSSAQELAGFSGVQGLSKNEVGVRRAALIGRLSEFGVDARVLDLPIDAETGKAILDDSGEPLDLTNPEHIKRMEELDADKKLLFSPHVVYDTSRIPIKGEGDAVLQFLRKTQQLQGEVDLTVEGPNGEQYSTITNAGRATVANERPGSGGKSNLFTLDAVRKIRAGQAGPTPKPFFDGPIPAGPVAIGQAVGEAGLEASKGAYNALVAAANSPAANEVKRQAVATAEDIEPIVDLAQRAGSAVLSTGQSLLESARRRLTEPAPTAAERLIRDRQLRLEEEEKRRQSGLRR